MLHKGSINQGERQHQAIFFVCTIVIRLSALAEAVREEDHECYLNRLPFATWRSVDGFLLFREVKCSCWIFATSADKRVQFCHCRGWNKFLDLFECHSPQNSHLTFHPSTMVHAICQEHSRGSLKRAIIVSKKKSKHSQLSSNCPVLKLHVLPN